MQNDAIWYNMMQNNAIWYNMMPYDLQHYATGCNMIEFNVIRCNILQHDTVLSIIQMMYHSNSNEFKWIGSEAEDIGFSSTEVKQPREEADEKAPFFIWLQIVARLPERKYAA